MPEVVRNKNDWQCMRCAYIYVARICSAECIRM